MAKFDKSRDYGEVIGDAGGARYFQDGLYFDAQGDELPGQTAPKAPRAKKAAEPVTDDQVKAFLGEEGGLAS